MKQFFLDYGLTILFICLGLLFFFLGSVCIYLSPIGLVCGGVGLIFASINSHKKYKKILSEQIEENEDFIDARKFGYDEDVYYVSTKPRNGNKKRNKLSKANLMFPTICFAVLSVGFIIMGITSMIKIFI